MKIIKSIIALITISIGITALAREQMVPELPNVLIIGDSISIGYTKPLKQNLSGIANVIHNPGNAQDSAFGLANLDA